MRVGHSQISPDRGIVVLYTVQHPHVALKDVEIGFFKIYSINLGIAISFLHMHVAGPIIDMFGWFTWTG